MGNEPQATQPTQPPRQTIIGLDLATLPHPEAAAAILAQQPDIDGALAAAARGNRAGILLAWPGILLGNAKKIDALTSAVQMAIEKHDTGAAVASLASRPDAIIAAVGVAIVDADTLDLVDSVAIYPEGQHSPFDSPEQQFTAEREVLADLAGYLEQALESGALACRQSAAFGLVRRATAHGITMPIERPPIALNDEIKSLAEYARGCMPPGTMPPPSSRTAQQAAAEGELASAGAVCQSRAEMTALIVARLSKYSAIFSK